MRAATWRQLIIGCLFFTISQIGLLYVFPILPDITQDFFPQLSESELGFRQGYLAGIYFLGNLFGSLVWGKISDKIGRKWGFILSTILYTTCIALFGLSVSFSMALVMRFLWGLFNGSDTIAKTFAAEISENNRDLAQAISSLGLTDGMGRFLGPTISAWLSRPADKVSWLDNPFFRRFPYFLPSTMCLALAIVVILIGIPFMKETVRRRGDAKSSAVVEKKYTLLGMRENGESSGSEDEEEESQQSEDTQEKLLHSKIRCNIKQKVKNIFGPVMNRSVLTAILVYNTFCLSSIQVDELIPLMLVTSPANGGICMSETGLGFITLCVSVIQIPWSLVFSPFIISRLGIRKSLRVFLTLYCITVFLLPLWTRNRIVENSFYNVMMSRSNNKIFSNGSTILLNDTMLHPSVFNASGLHISANSTVVSLVSCGGAKLGITDIPAKLWLIFFTVFFPSTLFRISTFACCTMGIANSATREGRATVNGVSQSGAALMRLIGPIFCANIFAWSISLGHGWPFDATLIWSLVCFQLMILFAFSFLYTPQVEHPIDCTT